jgi:hypothetical protein
MMAEAQAVIYNQLQWTMAALIRMIWLIEESPGQDERFLDRREW